MSLLDRNSLGKSGEDCACRELEGCGYAILARRYRSRFGEIDIVAREGEIIVFVEVKARTSDGYVEPAEAVTLSKQSRVAAIVEDYLARRRLRQVPCRFNVVAVALGTDGRPVVEVFQSAFDAAYR